MEYGVLHKLLFGSDYPVTTPASTVEALAKVNDLIRGTSCLNLAGKDRRVDSSRHAPADRNRLVFRLDANVSLVTGAAQGLGAAISSALARQGSDVIITDRPGASLENTASHIRSVGRRPANGLEPVRINRHS